jgi:hypothetical protein
MDQVRKRSRIAQEQLHLPIPKSDRLGRIASETEFGQELVYQLLLWRIPVT